MHKKTTTFGEVIKNKRKNKSWTQADLAKKSGIDSTLLSRIENNAYFPSNSQIIKISESLEIDTNYLFFLLGKIPPDYVDCFSILLSNYPKIMQEVFDRLKKNPKPDSLHDALGSVVIAQSTIINEVIEESKEFTRKLNAKTVLLKTINQLIVDSEDNYDD